MSKKTRNKKHDNDLELLENPEALAEKLSKGEEFVRENSNKITYVVGGIVLVIVLGWFAINSTGGINIAGLRYATQEKENEAQAEMFQAQFYFEADSIDKALAGDGNSLGFEEIIESYGMTNAGNVARFYAGVCYLKKGQFEEAIDYLDGFSTSDLLLQARAYSLVGDANMELDDVDNAIKYYKKASNENPNLYFTPTYLMKLALAYESNKDYASAVKTYDRIISEFPTATELNDAKKYKALAEGLASK